MACLVAKTLISAEKVQESKRLSMVPASTQTDDSIMLQERKHKSKTDVINEMLERDMAEEGLTQIVMDRWPGNVYKNTMETKSILTTENEEREESKYGTYVLAINTDQEEDRIIKEMKACLDRLTKHEIPENVLYGTTIPGLGHTMRKLLEYEGRKLGMNYTMYLATKEFRKPKEKPNEEWKLTGRKARKKKGGDV
ncbi:hypothetical protein J6590_062489 [Homalodisca vitripennis]|nr:hypothetical protein J6590_062489 [Homalodisca vitripennis]